MGVALDVDMECRNYNIYSQPPAGWSQAPQVLTNAPPDRRCNHVWERIYSQPPAGWSQAPQVLTNVPPVRCRNHVWVDSCLIHYVQVMKQNIYK